MNSNKILLGQMLEDMNRATEIYRPTNFWEKGLKMILSDLKNEEDFQNFRNHKSAKKMYVPVYEHHLYKKYRNLINLILKIKPKQPVPEIEGIFGIITGYLIAKNDYRVFLATNKKGFPEITEVQESLVGNPVEYFSFDNKIYSRSFLNYLNGINFLKNNADISKIRHVIEIGGGYGSLGEILLKSSSDFFYVNIDIPPVASISTYYLKKVFGEENVLGYSESRESDILDMDKIRQKFKIVVLCPWQIEKIRGTFDLFVNFMSFQEMEPNVVKNYIEFVERVTTEYVLLRNSRHGKLIAQKKNKIGVIEPISLKHMTQMFNYFTVVNSDYRVYGTYSKNFISELTCLKRNNK